jgi:SAM-dependent methyltransferase
MDERGAPRLYSELASWWPLLSAPEDYAPEADHYQRIILEACANTPRQVLELGSGGGNNASHMKTIFEMTLVDQSPEMLQVSKEINPDCEHLQGDMRMVRLGRVFDAIFIHDAIVYMTSATQLRLAIETAYVHCRSAGAALFVPDYVKENFRAGTKHGGHDGATRALRYLSWTWDPVPSDDTYWVDFAYLLRDETGDVALEGDRHQCGIFSKGQWMGMMKEVGFYPQIHHGHVEGEDAEGSVIFVGKKP